MDSLSGIFNGKIIGLNKEAIVNSKPAIFTTGTILGGSINLKGKAAELERKLTKHKLPNPEIKAWTNIRQQKKLPLWGDKDRDGVKNILDCAPYNKMKQGFWDATAEFVLGKKKESTIQTTLVSPEKTNKVKQFLDSRRDVLAERRQTQEEAKQLYEQARIEARGEIEKQKALTMQMFVQKAAVKQAQYDAKPFWGKAKELFPILNDMPQQGYGQQPSYQGAISGAQGFQINQPGQVTGYQLGQYPGAREQYFGEGQNILDRTPPKAFGQQTIPGMVGPTGVPTQSSGPQGPAPFPGAQWSEKSKKWVRYTRRPYIKHPKQYSQYQQQQYPQRY